MGGGGILSAMLLKNAGKHKKGDTLYMESNLDPRVPLTSQVNGLLSRTVIMKCAEVERGCEGLFKETSRVKVGSRNSAQRQSRLGSK